MIKYNQFRRNIEKVDQIESQQLDGKFKPSISVVILHVCRLNVPLGVHKIVSLLKPNYMLLVKEILKIYDTEKLKVKKQRCSMETPKES